MTQKNCKKLVKKIKIKNKKTSKNKRQGNDLKKKA